VTYINDFSVSCAMGRGRAAVGDALTAPIALSEMARLIDGRETKVGRLPGQWAPADRGGSRTNELVALLADDMRASIGGAIDRHGPSRVAFVLGTSTTGIDEAAAHLRTRMATGAWPDSFRFARQELGDPSEFGARHTGAGGPVYTVSTACTSGAKAIAAGARLIEAGLADAAVVGGADTLCGLTLNGFAALESIATGVCNPLSVNRCGINVGEGGALFLLSREPGPWRLEGWGESSDAHHASAPDPTGAGAEIAVRQALRHSGVSEGDVGFIHLHGTATRLNDQMEAVLVHRVFGADMPCASSKPMTGHTLGASGAVQAALSLLAMERGVYPPHLWDGERDAELPMVRLAAAGESPDSKVERMLSLSFAFGGNNVALMLGRG